MVIATAQATIFRIVLGYRIRCDMLKALEYCWISSLGDAPPEIHLKFPYLPPGIFSGGDFQVALITGWRFPFPFATFNCHRFV